MWFKNLIVYRLSDGWNVDASVFEERLRTHAFMPGMALDVASIGWAPPRDADASLTIAAGPHLLFALREEKKLLPPKVIAQVLKERVEKLEAEEGVKPGRKRLKEMREAVRDELLPRAFSLATDTRAWLDTRGGWLVIDAASQARADELLTLLIKTLEDVPVSALRVSASVTGEMTAWLLEDQAPGRFTIDQDVELRARDGKAKIRYANQSIDRAEVDRHARAGKQCSRLALTWADRVSLVVTDKLQLKRIRALDVLKESEAAQDADADARFVSDFTLMTGELSTLLADLVEAFGGHAAAEAGTALKVAA